MNTHKKNRQDTADRIQDKARPRAICFILFTAYCLLFILSSCSPRERIFKKSRILMDTLVTITVVSASEEAGEKAIDKAFAAIEEIEKLTNFFSSESEIAGINRSAGVAGVRVSADTMNLLDRALYVSENTGGAFDVTIGPVESLYDFHKKIKPEESVLKEKVPLVDYKELILDKGGSTVFLRKKGMLIDPGGIAKGYAADKAVETLKKIGISSGIVAVAGDVKAFGHKPDGGRWKIGIRHPRAADGENDIMATIELSDEAVSTSGDYERFFVTDGMRYHHLLSPKTGHPARECQSATVITKDGAMTDAFATGVFVLGPEEGMKVLQKMGFGGIIVDNRGEIITTPEIGRRIEFKRVS